MKRIKFISSIALCAFALASCSGMLDLHNPNYFTEEEMNEYLKENPSADESIISGLCAGLYGYITVANAATNGGYSNTGMYESYKDFSHLCQTGDIVEGAVGNAGTFSKWYQNLASNTYWERTNEVDCYGYYYSAVLKVQPAQKALDYLPASKVAERPELAQYRAQALTLKALAYIQLMERFTDLDAETIVSETKQGWPVYEEYIYSEPKEPLSCKATWAWINRQLEEADSLFSVSSLGNKGYTVYGTTKNANDLFDIDRGVCQYYRCRAALDSRDWNTVIKAGNELLAQYPDFIAAEDYGMPASVLPTVQRTGVTADKPFGTGWAGEFPANKNGLISNELNPETLFGNGDKSSSTQFWSVLGLNPLKHGPSGYYQMDQKLYDSMSDADCRKACVLSEDFDGLVVYSKAEKDTTFSTYTMPKYTSLKWGATCGLDQTNHSIENTFANSCWLRKSAVLLMVAEAYAQSGNTTGAKSLLNQLLAARTLPGYSAMTCSTGSLEEVQTQWRIEMWGEGDWAFYNCKRWGHKSFDRGSNHWSTATIPTSGWTWEVPEKQERQGNPYWNN